MEPLRTKPSQSISLIFTTFQYIRDLSLLQVSKCYLVTFSSHVALQPLAYVFPCLSLFLSFLTILSLTQSKSFLLKTSSTCSIRFYGPYYATSFPSNLLIPLLLLFLSHLLSIHDKPDPNSGLLVLFQLRRLHLLTHLSRTL